MRASIGIDLQSKIGIPELRKLQNLPSIKGKYQINLYSTRLMESRVFRGPDAQKQINLLTHDYHYYAVTSMPALFGTDNFCDKGGAKIKS